MKWQMIHIFSAPKDKFQDCYLRVTAVVMHGYGGPSAAPLIFVIFVVFALVFLFFLAFFLSWYHPNLKKKDGL